MEVYLRVIGLDGKPITVIGIVIVKGIRDLKFIFPGDLKFIFPDGRLLERKEVVFDGDEKDEKDDEKVELGIQYAIDEEFNTIYSATVSADDIEVVPMNMFNTMQQFLQYQAEELKEKEQVIQELGENKEKIEKNFDMARALAIFFAFMFGVMLVSAIMKTSEQRANEAFFGMSIIPATQFIAMSHGMNYEDLSLREKDEFVIIASSNTEFSVYRNGKMGTHIKREWTKDPDIGYVTIPARTIEFEIPEFKEGEPQFIAVP